MLTYMKCDQSIVEYIPKDSALNLEAVETVRRCDCGKGVNFWKYVEVKQQAHYWYAQHARAVIQRKEVQDELEAAKAELRLLKQKIYGKSSEKKKKTEQQNKSKNDKKNKGQQPGSKGHGRISNDDLEMVEEFIELPAEKLICACCKLPYHELNSTEDSECIEIFVKGYIRKIKRKKYKKHVSCHCKQSPKIITAPAANKLIPKGKLGVSVWSQILLDKYESHRPTNRYLEHLKHFGISISQGTVTDGLKKLLPLFEPIVNEFYKKSQLESHWHADETRWAVYESIEGKHTYRWYLWIFKSKSVVCFILDPSRGYSVPEKFFEDVKGGIINCDRYIVYKKLSKDSGIILSFCWAHVRRDFLNAAKSYPELEGWALEWITDIGNLYHSNKERLAIDIKEPARALAQIKLDDAVLEMRNKCTAELQEQKLHIGRKKVLDSLCNHWNGLTVFVNNPEIPMDNNAAESGLRGSVLGRKNYSGSGSIWSAQLAAMMFSIIQTIKLWGANPLDWFNCYLRACLENGNKPPENLNLFLPWEVVKGKNDSNFAKSASPNSS